MISNGSARQWWIASIVAVGLTGCADSRHQTLKDLGFVRPYLEGYQDGCSSREQQADTYHDGFRQDPERMYSDGKYANGWQDGYEHCYAANQDYL